MAKLRSRILFLWHLVWFAVLLLSYQLQNESCRLVPEPLNRCLTFGGRYIFMTHLLQLSSKVRSNEKYETHFRLPMPYLLGRISLQG